MAIFEREAKLKIIYLGRLKMSLNEQLTKKDKITKIMDWVEFGAIDLQDSKGIDSGIILVLRVLNETLQICDEETVDQVYKERII